MKLKNTINSNSFLEYSNDNITMASGPMSISSHKDHGNFINGPLSITGPFTNIRFSGMFKLNPLLSLGLPSTIITPIPTFEIDMPIKEAASFGALSGMIMSTVAG